MLESYLLGKIWLLCNRKAILSLCQLEIAFLVFSSQEKSSKIFSEDPRPCTCKHLLTLYTSENHIFVN